MALKKLERVNFPGNDSQDVKRLQDIVSRAVDPITTVPILDGRIIGPITLTSVAQPVNHGLGRQYLGWILIRVASSAAVSEDINWSQQTTSISMRCSAGTVVVYLWVF